MYQHIRPIHMIGAVSPADCERLAVRLTRMEGRRGAEPEAGEPMLQDVTLTCSPRPALDDSCALVDLSATARVAGGGEIKSGFRVEVHLAEGRHRTTDDFGSLEVIKELAWPPVRQALQQFAHMLIATVEMEATSGRRPRRPGLMDRLRCWAAGRERGAGR